MSPVHTHTPHSVMFIETSSLESAGLSEAYEGEAVGDIYSYYYLFWNLMFFLLCCLLSSGLHGFLGCGI